MLKIPYCKIQMRAYISLDPIINYISHARNAIWMKFEKRGEKIK